MERDSYIPEELKTSDIEFYEYQGSWRIADISPVISSSDGFSVVDTALNLELTEELPRNMARAIVDVSLVDLMMLTSYPDIEAIIPLDESGESSFEGMHQVIFARNHRNILTPYEIMTLKLEVAKQIFSTEASTSDLVVPPLPDGISIVRLQARDIQNNPELVEKFQAYVTTTFSDSAEEVLESIKDRTSVNLAAVRTNANGERTIVGSLVADLDESLVSINGTKKPLYMYEVSEAKASADSQQERKQILERLTHDVLKNLTRRKNIHGVIHYIPAGNADELAIAAKAGFKIANGGLKLPGIAKQADTMNGERTDFVVATLSRNQLIASYRTTAVRRSRI